MKFICIKDPHLSFGFQNKIRKNYSEQIEKKLDFISNHAVENNIKNIIFTGDVFDQSQERQWTFRQFLQNKKMLEKYFIEKGLILYSPAGNHDYFNGKETIDNTVFGEMVADNIINYIGDKYVEFSDLGIQRPVRLWGIDHSNDKNKVMQRIYEINESKTTLNIVVIHMNVTKEAGLFTDFTKEFLANTFENIHIWILGHYHIGSKPDVINKKIFIDPWNLVRVARDYPTKMNKFDVNMNVLTISTETGITVDEVQIPHLEFKEAFVDEYVNLLLYDKKSQFEFFNNLDLDEVINDSDSNDNILEMIAQKNNFSSESVKIAQSYLN